MSDGTISVVAELDTSNYVSGVKQITKANQDIEKSSKQADEATGKVGKSSNADEIKAKFNALAGVLKKTVVAGATAAGAGVLAMGKSAVDAYSNYEQAVGGVETLFKNSASTVERYAADAYRTAGVGANDYMNLMTSFAASLIGSLGGDTAKAAEMGNQAITDMSDNANKMGTDLGIIQQTYQSLARGNYAMLDNLKLGYGGTKAEMQRMIEDANNVKKANGEMADLSIDSFADVTEAIHITQTQLGITGTTAKEAATTIEGSFNQMKASWSNWLTALAGGGDLGAATQQLVASAQTYLSNLLPAVQRTVSSMAQMIVNGFTTAFASLPAPAQLAIGLFGGMTVAVGALTAAMQLQKTVTTALQIAQLALNAVMAANPIIFVITAIGALVGALTVFFTSTETGRQLWAQFIAFLEPLWNQVMAVWLPVWNTIQNTVTTIFNAIWSFIQSLLPEINSTWSSAWNSVKGLFEDVWNLMEAFVVPVLQTIWNVIQTVVTNISNFIQNNMTTIRTVWSSVWNIIKTVASSVWNGIGTIVLTAINLIRAVIQTVTALIRGDWSGVWNGIKSIASILWNGITSLIGNGINMVRNVIGSVLNIIRAIWSSVWNGVKSVAMNVWNGITGVVSGAVNGIRGTVGSAMNFVRGIMSGAWNAIRGTVSSAWNGIVGAVRGGASNILGAIRGLPGSIMGIFSGAGSWLVNSGRSIINGLKDGIMNAIQGVKDTVSGALSSIRDLFPFSPAKEGPFSGRGWVLYSGESIAEAFGEGIRKNENKAISSAMSLMNDMQSSLNVGVTGKLPSMPTVPNVIKPEPAVTVGGMTQTFHIVNPDASVVAAKVAADTRTALQGVTL